MDGFELARADPRERSRDRAQTRPPILAVTASTVEEQEERSRAAGMDGFITKPVGIEQLQGDSRRLAELGCARGERVA